MKTQAVEAVRSGDTEDPFPSFDVRRRIAGEREMQHSSVPLRNVLRPLIGKLRSLRHQLPQPKRFDAAVGVRLFPHLPPAGA